MALIDVKTLALLWLLGFFWCLPAWETFPGCPEGQAELSLYLMSAASREDDSPTGLTHTLRSLGVSRAPALRQLL